MKRGQASTSVRRLIALAAAALALPAAAPVTPVTPVDVEHALRFLLAATSLPVTAATPSCGGLIVGVPKPTLGDMLAIPFGGLDGGVNRVAGGCIGDQCSVQIGHDAGDDVYSYEYRFKTARGKLVPASLQCFSTP